MDTDTDLEKLKAELLAVKKELKEEQVRRVEEQRKHTETQRILRDTEMRQLEIDAKQGTERVPQKHYLYLVDEHKVNVESLHAVAKYRKMAQRIRNDEKARNFIDALWVGFQESLKSGVFNALCVPSGTGKTQLAFSLPPDQCGCIYLNVTYGRYDCGTRQSIYDAFEYMQSLMSWIREDYVMGRDSSRADHRIYAFIDALMSLLIKCPELELPGDLTRLKLSQTCPGGVYEEVMYTTDISTVQTKIDKWSSATGRKAVFFVDEFAPSVVMGQEELAFLRRNLMNLGECVIVASTDSGALNMFNVAAATAGSRQSMRKWVNLCTQLPAYVPADPARAAVDNCASPAVKTLFDLCLKSRPLLAESVAEKITDFLNASRKYPMNSLIPFIESLREDLVHVLQTKESAKTVDGCFGFIVAMLLAGGALLSQDENLRHLFGGLTTKNWAYLVHDQEILRTSPPSSQNAKRMRVEKDGYMGMSNRQAEPSFLMLWRKRGSPTGKDNLFFLGSVETEHHPFTCRSFFPDPNEDFLLYLVLAGSVNQPGLILADERGLNERISVAKLVGCALENNRILPQSTNEILPGFAQHEAVVCAAFFTACNSGGLSGCSLEQLITRFLAELIRPYHCSHPNLTTVDKIKWNGHFKAQFMLPFDTKVPPEVLRILGMAQCSRPPRIESVDAVTFVSGSKIKRYQILVEAKTTTNPDYVKDRIQSALQSQDSHAVVSFIVVDKSPNDKLIFDPIQIESLNRNKKEGRKYAVADQHWNFRVFLVDVDESNKVVLKPLDGAPLHMKADRLIFVVCLGDLSRKFMRE